MKVGILIRENIRLIRLLSKSNLGGYDAWSTEVINMYNCTGLQLSAQAFSNKPSSSIWSLICPLFVENQVHIADVNEDEQDKFFMKTTVCNILIWICY